MPLSKLLFFPKDNQQLISNQEILKIISHLQLINIDAHEENHYLPGENFLSLLIFLGCSPNINLQPTPNESHCYISLIAPTDNERCLGYTTTCHPKCPDCKKRIKDWETEGWQDAGTVCQCDKCGTKTVYAQLNWKHECGFGRCGFEIAHIYPHEAVPTDQLLDALNQQTGIEWLYSYANN